MKSISSLMKLPVGLLMVLLIHTHVYGQNSGTPKNLKATVYMNDSTIKNGPVIFEDDSILVIQTENGKIERINKSGTQRIEYDSYDQPVIRAAIPVEVIFLDGNILRGEMRSENENTITFYSTLTGERIIERKNILSITHITDLKSGNNQVYINLASRYFISPSAIQMKKGDGYYQNTYFLLNSFNYAFTDNLSTGLGFETFSFFSGKPIYFFQVKTGMEVADKLHFGLGLMHMNFSLIDEELNSFNLAFFTATVGNPDYNFSINYAFDPKSINNDPLITFSGFARLNPKLGFISENWLYPVTNEGSFFGFGCRVIGRKNLFDVGILTNTEIMNDGWIGIPYLSYTLRF